MRGLLCKQILIPSLLLSGMLPFASVRAADAVTDHEKQDIAQLMSLTQTEQMVDYLSEAMAKGLFDTPNPNVSQNDMTTLKLQARKVILAELNKPGGLFDQAATFYMQHFTDDEIKQLISFYQSALGKKILASEPDMTRLAATFLQTELLSIDQAYKKQITLCAPAQAGGPLKCPE